MRPRWPVGIFTVTAEDCSVQLGVAGGPLLTLTGQLAVELSLALQDASRFAAQERTNPPKRRRTKATKP